MLSEKIEIGLASGAGDGADPRLINLFLLESLVPVPVPVPVPERVEVPAVLATLALVDLSTSNAGGSGYETPGGIGAVAYPSLCECPCPSFDPGVRLLRGTLGLTLGGEEDMCMTVTVGPERGTNPIGSSFTTLPWFCM